MDHINNKIILLLGGAGFIGSHLADFLLVNKAKHIIVIDNLFLGSRDNLSLALQSYPGRLTFIEADACDNAMLSSVIEQYKPEIVVNLATKALLHSFVDPLDAYKVNTDIALNLLELIRHNKYKKLVHISTSEVFGTAEYVPMDEEHPRKPETTYAAGKCAADLAVESYVNMFKVNAIILRPFNNFGPRQNHNALAAIIPKTVKNILLGGVPVIEGDGLQTRDFIYVEDTVKIIAYFLKDIEFPHIEYNIGSGVEITIQNIINTICSIMEYSGQIKYVPARVADVRRHRADITRLTGIFGDIQLTSFETAMQQTIEAYLESINIVEGSHND